LRKGAALTLRNPLSLYEGNKKMRKPSCGKLVSKIGKLFYVFVIVFLVVIAVVVFVSAFKIPGGLRIFTVQSGSMVPALRTGSIAINKSQSVYKVGDIITFFDNKNPKETITHRIVEIKTDNNSVRYVTRGDANNASDSEERPKESVLGKVLFSIPYVGYPVAFAKTQIGFLLLIVIPATILIYSEIMNIKEELSEIFKKRNDKKNKTKTIA
jgi:signal peptidase